jgi:predicted phosphodiesterase
MLAISVSAGCGVTRTESAATMQDAASKAVPPASSESVPPGNPLFVFAAVGDPHIAVNGTFDHKYIKAGDKGPQLLATFVRDINAHSPRVDFVVLLGDVTDKGNGSEFALARKILDSLACPLYPLVGNHDNFESDNKQGWKRFARRDSTNYTFDVNGFHFIAIDCTDNPYTPGAVGCDSTLRLWVAKDLERNQEKPTFVLSHYNMWERFWNSQFDTTRHYAEYSGIKDLRQVLERAGNVVAVINGHVHANRVEQHNGIYYIDVGATLVGRPSIRYFYVFPDRVEVTYAYVSDVALLDYVVQVGTKCLYCFDSKAVVDYADGKVSDKQFTIPLLIAPMSR